MPRVREKDAHYLGMNGGWWRISMPVPSELRGILGSRMCKTLNTRSKAEAITLSIPYVADMKRLMNDAWLAHPSGGKKHHPTYHAVEIARIRDQILSDMSRDRFHSLLRERCDEILVDPTCGETVKQRKTVARMYMAVATGKDEPLALRLPDHTQGLSDREAELAKDSVHRLGFWLIRNGHDLLLDRFDSRLFDKFAESYDDFFKSGPEVGEVRRSIHAYWEHLVAGGFTAQNPITPDETSVAVPRQ